VELFENAIANKSTSPSFVLITVVDATSGQEHVVCTEAPLLLGALHREYGLGYTAEADGDIDRMALSNSTRVFTFSERKALLNVQPRYTDQMLKDVRSQLADLSDDDLRGGFGWPDGPLHRIYQDSSDMNAYRDAVSHVLLERCIAVRLADRSGMLRVEEDRLTSR